MFKAAFYSVMRDSAKKDVEDKRMRLLRRQGSENEGSDNSSDSGSPTGGRGM